MSKLAQSSGDDYPEAASMHLQDSAALLAATRPDGAAYLSGYVVECSLKSIIQLESGTVQKIHGLSKLHHSAMLVAAIAGAKTAKYLGPGTTGILSTPMAAWDPVMRYRPPPRPLRPLVHGMERPPRSSERPSPKCVWMENCDGTIHSL